MEIPAEFQTMVIEDIKRIEKEIEKGTNESRWQLFRELDGKYQACIKDFYRGMWGATSSGDRLFFPQLHEKPNYVLDNLKMVKSKLETFRFGANATYAEQMPSTQVNVHNNIGVNVTFEQVYNEIEEMTSLTDEQTREVLDKLSEIKEIVESSGTRKSKWERIKPTLKWLADKSCDVGIALLPLILKIQ